jgi:menaquinone-dependent protoporphyrinogen oxidase
MKVLVAVGSKYGATREIAQTIAEVLRDFGFDALWHDARDVESLASFDAAIIGSAVYGGFWRRDASSLIHDHAEELQKIPVWLFSSGPVGLPPRPSEPAGEGDSLVDVINAYGHIMFSGYLNPERLNFGERAIIRGLKASVGDYREWGQVKNWAREIAHQLTKISQPKTEQTRPAPAEPARKASAD